MAREQDSIRIAITAIDRTLAAPAIEAAAVEAPARSRRLVGAAARVARRYPVGVLSALVLAGFGVVALLAPWLAPYPADQSGLGLSLAGPSMAHPFGLDQLGRDVLSRVIWGSRVSFATGLASTGIALAVGIAAGATSAYFGGVFDLAVQRVVETVNVFPSLVFALLLVAMFGQSTANIIAALSISMAPGMARLARASVIAVRSLPYIESARAVGADSARVLLRHVLPNVAGSLTVMATLAVGGAITAEASLAFLGIGGSPTDASWGRMLAQASSGEVMRHASHLAYFPGIVLTVVVLAVNLAGDALRDVLDPRGTRGGRSS